MTAPRIPAMVPFVLAVDDDGFMRVLLERAFIAAGIQVETFASASELLASEHLLAPAVVLLDIQMPGMSGLELLNRIRAIHPLVRSIIVSGKVDPDWATDEVEARLKAELEADAYFSKPVANELLLERIEQLLTLSDEQKWEDVAARILTATRPATQVKKAERALKRPKRGKRP